MAMKPRTEYATALRSNLDEWNRRIDRLESDLNHVEADLREEYREVLGELKSLRQLFQHDLKRLQRSSLGAWEETRRGINRAWKELDQSLNRAAGRFEKDRSPKP